GPHLLVFGGYLLLTLALTYPIAKDLFTRVPGGGDAWQHIWNLWWVKHALLDLHTNPYHTELIYYPNGVNLYLHTLVLTAGLIGIPLQLLGFGLVPTYNLLILLSFLLAGYGAFLVCHYLTGHTWASFAGGFVFAFSPYHLAHLFGHLNLASLQWIPFYVLLLLKAVDAPLYSGSGPGIRNQELGIRRTNLTSDSRLLTPALELRKRSLLLSAGAGALLAV